MRVRFPSESCLEAQSHNGDELDETVERCFLDPGPHRQRGDFRGGGRHRSLPARHRRRHFASKFTSPLKGEVEFTGSICYDASDRGQ